jgi:pSer/pThr/pTyr-binding forkhead associated (FHA) protein
VDSGQNNVSAALLIVGSSKLYSFEKEVITIGRLDDNDLILDDPRVSRHHAELRYHNGCFIVSDLNSTGGTFVNGNPTNKQVLEEGDVITLASVHLVFGHNKFPTSESTSGYIPPKIKPQADLHTGTLSPNTIPIRKNKE